MMSDRNPIVKVAKSVAAFQAKMSNLFGQQFNKMMQPSEWNAPHPTLTFDLPPRYALRGGGTADTQPPAPPRAAKKGPPPRHTPLELTPPMGYDPREEDPDYSIQDQVFNLCTPVGVPPRPADIVSDVLETTSCKPFHVEQLPAKPWPPEFESMMRERRAVNLQGTAWYTPQD